MLTFPSFLSEGKDDSSVSDGEGDGNPLQYSCLENPMDGGAWWAAVHGVARNWTRLSDFTFTFQFPALEREMATHSSVLAWRIPGTREPGGLPSVGLHRVGHNWSDLAVAFLLVIFLILKYISKGRFNSKIFSNILNSKILKWELIVQF